jgi:hypothetical protein
LRNLATRRRSFATQYLLLRDANGDTFRGLDLPATETVLEEPSGGCAVRWPGEPSLWEQSYAYDVNLYRVVSQEMSQNPVLGVGKHATAVSVLEHASQSYGRFQIQCGQLA